MKLIKYVGSCKPNKLRTIVLEQIYYIALNKLKNDFFFN